MRSCSESWIISQPITQSQRRFAIYGLGGVGEYGAVICPMVLLQSFFFQYIIFGILLLTLNL